MKAAAVLHKNAPAAPASPLAHPSGSPMHAAGPLGAGAPAVDEEEASDYTDADESISAPTEFLAEFLSAIMGKDYPTALKYCKLILQYEPNNRTAREFYPLIVEKLVQSTIDEARTDSEDESSSGGSGSLTGSGSDDEDSGSDLSDDEDDEDDDDEEGEGLEPRRGQEHNDNSSAEYGDTDGTTASYSSLEDEEADPADSTDTAGMANDNEDVENGNQEYLQVLHDAQLANKVTKLTLTAPGTAAPGAAARCSDSESPTEPVSQQLVADLRARALPAASVPASPARAGQAGRR